MTGNDKITAMTGIVDVDAHFLHIAKIIQNSIYFNLNRYMPNHLGVVSQAATDGANEAMRIVRMVLEEA